MVVPTQHSQVATTIAATQLNSNSLSFLDHNHNSDLPSSHNTSHLATTAGHILPDSSPLGHTPLPQGLWPLLRAAQPIAVSAIQGLFNH